MSTSESVVFSTYSAMADTYDAVGNVESCWGMDTDRIIRSIRLRENDRLVADIGCGTGVALVDLAPRAAPWTHFVGVEPAENMRLRAEAVLRDLRNVELRDGAFERMPLDDRSVDHMISINAFHWVADVAASIREMQRVMAPDGLMDHFFIGRDIGREFVAATTPIFLKHMGARRLLQAARMRQVFTCQSAAELFADAFGAERVHVTERYDTYYDTVEGHLGWWVRIEPQLLAIPAERRAECEAEVRAALAGLDDGRGVPYTKHTLHVRVGPLS